MDDIFFSLELFMMTASKWYCEGTSSCAKCQEFKKSHTRQIVVLLRTVDDAFQREYLKDRTGVEHAKEWVATGREQPSILQYPDVAF